MLSAGGLHAAWQVGCMESLAKFGLVEGQWASVLGTSAGAVNAACMAQTSVGREVQAVEELAAFWDVYSKALVRPRVPTMGRAIFSMYTGGDSALSVCEGSDACLLDELVYGISIPRIRDSDRRLSVVLTSYMDGKHVVTSHDPDLKAAIKASMAVPMLFPPQEVMLRGGPHDPLVKHWCCDGAVVESIPTAIENEPSVDVILASPLARERGEHTPAAPPEPMPPPSIATAPWLIIQKTMEAQQKRSLDMIRMQNPSAYTAVFSPPTGGSETPFYAVSHQDVMATMSRGAIEGMDQALRMDAHRPSLPSIPKL